MRDHGRGIPVDTEPRTGLSGVEVVFTKLHARGQVRRRFLQRDRRATRRRFVVNALSSRLDVEVDRNSATWAMSFRRGVPGTFDGPGPAAKFTPSSLRKIGRVPKGTTGTRVTYWPDRQIFLHDAQLSFPGPPRPRQTSFLVPGLALHIADTRTREVIEETYLHQGGISEFNLRIRPCRHRCDPASRHRSVHRDRPHPGRSGPHGRRTSSVTSRSISPLPVKATRRAPSHT